MKDFRAWVKRLQHPQICSTGNKVKCPELTPYKAKCTAGFVEMMREIIRIHG